MCFTTFWKVDGIEHPYYDDYVTVHHGKGWQPEDYSRATQSSLNLLLNNLVVEAALKKVEDIVPKRVVDLSSVATEWDRMVVICDVMGSRYIDYTKIHKDQVFAINDVRLQNKIIVLQLKDFSCLAMYSMHPVDKKDLSGGIGSKTRVKILPTLDFDQAEVYEFTYLYW